MAAEPLSTVLIFGRSLPVVAKEYPALVIYPAGSLAESSRPDCFVALPGGTRRVFVAVYVDGGGGPGLLAGMDHSVGAAQIVCVFAFLWISFAR